MANLIEDLHNLHKQATVEHSHYYVAGCVERAIYRISVLEAALAAIARPRGKLNAEVAASMQAVARDCAEDV